MVLRIRLSTSLEKKQEILETWYGKQLKAALPLLLAKWEQLIEPTHNSHFVALMDQFMPKSRFYKDQLNKLPVRHVNWDY